MFDVALILSTLGWTAGGLIFFVIGTRVYDLVTPFSIRDELIRDRNMAVGYSMAGYLLGLSIILHGVMSSSDLNRTLLQEVVASIVFFLLGSILMALGRMILSIAVPFDLNHEISEADNPPVGLIEASLYVAVALIIHGVFIG